MEQLRRDVSDAELVAALTEGRPQAYRTAWERFAPLVGGLVRRTLGKDELEDVRQEVFSCLFRRVATLRDPLALRPFVLAITFNTIKYERRRRRKRARVTLMADPAQLQMASREQPAAKLAFGRFANLLGKLPPREQATFVSRFVAGMTVSQIAAAMSISEPTARRSFTRAWTRMQKSAERDPFLNEYLQGRRWALPAEQALADDEASEAGEASTAPAPAPPLVSLPRRSKNLSTATATEGRNFYDMVAH